jgi:NAD(P)-dependent dehydrogenase (short-subunit alcohol dehydrogenase family)
LETYSASKSAAWSLTNALRKELKKQGTQVIGVHAGLIDTDLTVGFDRPKSDPADIVARVLAALENGDEEVLADEISRNVKAGLSAEPPVYRA